jgi:hypothetical protein
MRGSAPLIQRPVGRSSFPPPAIAGGGKALSIPPDYCAHLNNCSVPRCLAFMISLPSLNREVGLKDQSPRLALRTRTVTTATLNGDAGTAVLSAMSASFVTAPLPRGSHAERILRGVDPGNRVALATAGWNFLREPRRPLRFMPISFRHEANEQAITAPRTCYTLLSSFSLREGPAARDFPCLLFQGPSESPLVR